MTQDMFFRKAEGLWVVQDIPTLAKSGHFWEISIWFLGTELQEAFVVRSKK